MDNGHLSDGAYSFINCACFASAGLSSAGWHNLLHSVEIVEYVCMAAMQKGAASFQIRVKHARMWDKLKRIHLAT